MARAGVLDAILNFKAIFVLCAIIRKWSRRLRKTMADERDKFLDAIERNSAMKPHVTLEKSSTGRNTSIELEASY